MADVIVIGSGFGGSIAAKRFTEAGYTVSLLELGENWNDPAKLEQSQDTKFILRLFRDYPVDYLQSKPRLVVTQGMGLGGGSLVYSGIHLRAPQSAFANGWPTGYSRANLDPYYSRVEARLGVQQMPDTFDYPRPAVFAQGAAYAGLPAPTANPLAMTDCTRCGWCVPICKWGRKNTTAKTYLADAMATGRLSIYTNRKAKYIARYGSKYRVVYWKTDGAVDNYHMVNSGALYYQEASTVVVACGAIESPVLLSRSLTEALPSGYQELNSFPTADLGYHIDGTGDFAVGGFVPQQTDTYKGAIMMANIDMGDYVLEDLHAIPVGPAVKLEAAVTIGGKDRTWGLAYKQRYRDFGAHLMLIGIMGKSPSGANISVWNDNGNAQLSGTAYQPPTGSMEAARSIITSLGGDLAKGPWERNGTAATVHPVGGCRMDSIVQPTDLQVFNNPGLYVIDGSVLPGGVFRNPSNTIAAIAEKAMDVILDAPGAPSW
ncbi:GMC family oxidoreductase N-terminal domain-containing protein [Haliangium sp.]|uniref:GMC family oxidoreductase N-terminal domain-containing protein n=1 Tax=Haliangium sp. TaxID=2663208 RepID=UPI003D10FAFC